MNKKVEKYHFIGIGGIGMSALAQILLDKKLPVSGSDLSTNDNIQKLVKKGAVVRKGHSAKHISHHDTVIYSSSIQLGNPEYQAALAMKCPMMHRSELLAELMKNTKNLAVTGTHGKTTTSALLTAVLTEADLDPTYAVGGLLGELNGKSGKGAHFVAEADESDGSFLHYFPAGAIVTNVEPEHMDHYKSVENLHKAFKTFFSQVKDPNLLFYCGDDPVLKKMGRGKSYGFDKSSDLVISNFSQKGWSIQFTLTFQGKVYSDITLALTGEHNALNGAAVFGLALNLGVEEAKIRSAFEKFSGVGRRCQKRREDQEVLCIDDYGHHPTEIKTTLKAVKQAVEERRLIVVFQPHRFTRTRDLIEEFGKAFDWADLVYVTDIYSAGENPIEGIDALKVVESVKKYSSVPCRYLPRQNWIEELERVARAHDVILSIGAGDITRLHDTPLKIKKRVVGLIFGGRSCEHEISLRSSKFIAESLNRNLYDVRFFGIDKKGDWILGKEAEELQQSQTVLQSPNAKSILDPLVTHALQECDLFFPILHGTYGEDGTMQGFFEMLSKPYAGPDYRSAALTMDKVLTKKLVAMSGVLTPNYQDFSYFQWLRERESLSQKIENTLTFPVYVKPTHLGSSVGISCVTDKKDLQAAIDFAFRYDTHVMVEEGKVECRELEFAVLGNVGAFRVEAPKPGEKLANGSFVDYERKYGTTAVSSTVDPVLSDELCQKGQMLAKKAYEAVGCTGLTRVDFLLDGSGNFWFFEMNSIPGMQKLSLFPKIWKREGLEPGKLMDRLIILALQRHRDQDRHYQTL